MPAGDTREECAPCWAEGFAKLRRQMDDWISASMAMQRHVPFMGVHDEGSFITCWLCHYQLTGDRGILEFARYLRDGFARWGRESLVSGFFPSGEVHHQTEIFNNFLLRLWHVDHDEMTARLLLDAAEHIGNWAPGYPEWYDWQADRFVGWHIGTVEMGQGDEFEVPDHFRLIQLALGAYEICGDERYLDLSVRWTRRWANALLDAHSAGDVGAAMQVGAAHDPRQLAYARGDHHAGAGAIGQIEPFVAAGAIDVLLDLHRITGATLYADAARALCAPLVGQLPDPDANPPGALLQRYRVDTGDASLDEAALGVLEGCCLQAPGEPIMMLDTPRGEPVAGIGKRSDMIRWAYRDESGRILPEDSPSPAALMLGYQISGDEAFAAWALEMAAGRLSLGRRLRDGRRHGCGGRSVSAIASGHGRDSGYGNITGSLYPLAHGAVKYLGHERPAVALGESDRGLPVDSAALTRRMPGAAPVTSLWNGRRLQTVVAP